ncbi:sensor histidine kinase [Thalassomonas haliotis]|uniref:histidine kinase n=1 Tax=Thalassomonas haliotis TaxID=485448 RepID=A0ABY7VA42_9GAMM|nr:HAMP domain-containing sensor histidine kinase [Thalassomonas haliotis]WDE09939.1 HAMP domain-containing histidine kinase [Thalassomonas haliotis]
MSLKSYLFALIGALIVLLTLSQLALVYWLEYKVADDVAQQARFLSKEVIDIAIDRIDDEQIKAEKQPGLAANSQPRQIKENSHMLLIEKQLPDKAMLKEHLIRLVDNIHDSKTLHSTDNSAFPKIIYKKTGNSQQLQISNSALGQDSKALIESIKIALIGSAVIALLFAYWLSSQFSKPLKNLASGFKQLASGDYQHQVPVQGVKEISNTIAHFNHMVERLAQLTEKEKQHKEIAHLAELGEVSRGLAHALRSPIHTIGLSIEQLTRDRLTPEQKKQLSVTVRDKIGHIDKNIKALLTLTTTGISRDEQIPLLAVVQDIMLEYKSSRSKKQLFDLQLPENLTITAAETEIRSILHTLIINACEANPEKAKVCIRGELNADNMLEITVTDQGPGLAPQVADKLFQPHVSTKASGAGMGLYIARRIISLHYRGNITLANNPQTSGCIATASFLQTREV